MRQFGGSDALPDLRELLDDNEPQCSVKRCARFSPSAPTAPIASRAGAHDRHDALAGSDHAVDQPVRDERAAPLFAYILGHVDRRGTLAPVYLRAIESLGALRDPAGIEPLKVALYKANGGPRGARLRSEAPWRRR